MKVLCIDIEGGHGGSSRSLFSAIKGMDRRDIYVEVVCRKKSQLTSEYADLDIPCSVWPMLPKRAALNSWLANIPSMVKFHLFDFPRTKKIRNSLLEKCKAFDVLHANHISLCPLTIWIRKHNPNIRIVTHIRTNPRNSIFARMEARQCLLVSDALVFITENEKTHFEMLVGQVVRGEIISNSAEISFNKSSSTGLLPENNTLQVLSLSNYSYARGVDRLLDVAQLIPKELRTEISFLIAGDMRDTSLLGRINPWQISFEEKVKRSDVREMFYFFGHVDDPNYLLRSATLLMKLTRENNPWGRDIIEALASGLAVVSVGDYDRLVRTNQTGLLQNFYDPVAIVEWLKDLMVNRTKIRSLSANAKRLAHSLCSVKRSSARLRNVWRETVGS